MRGASVLAALDLAKVVFQRPLEGIVERKVERRPRSLAGGHAAEKRIAASALRSISGDAKRKDSEDRNGK